MANALNWFEIPVTDFDRASNFYSKVFDTELHKMEMANTVMGMFPTDKGEVGGALIQGEGYVPSKTGTTIYLNGGEDLAAPLSRIEAAGGQVVMPKTDIGEDYGFFAIFIDTEGNKLGLHSPS